MTRVRAQEAAFAGCAARALLACLIPCSAFSAQSVEGHVVNAATGADLEGVTVILGQSGGHADGPPYRATTGEQGRFRIDDVRDGTYIATYRAKGFWSPHDPGDPTQPTYQVSGGAGTVHLDAALQPVPTLSGRVLDPAGTPVANATLWMIEQQHPCHSPSCLFVTKQWKSGEKGEFSTAEFDRPGTWMIAVAAPDSLPPPDPAGGETLAWAETFYPGVTDPAVAETIAVRAGVELPFIDIHLAARPSRRIRGRVLDAHGDPAPLVEVQLSNGFGPHDREAADDKGNFEFDDVTGGEWRVTATRGKRGEEVWAGKTIHVGQRDIEDAVLGMEDPIPLHGRIAFDAPESVTAPDADLPNVIADYDTGDFGQAAAPPGFPIGHPDEHGEFTIQAYPGRYRFVMIEEAPAGFYVDSIRVGEADALAADGIDVSSPAQPLTVTYKFGGGTVRGAVENCGNGRVAILPRDKALRLPQFIRQTNCGPGGRFEITAVRPGEYYGVSLAGDADVSGWALVNEEDLLEKQAVKITVRDGEAVSAEIRPVRF